MIPEIKDGRYTLVLEGKLKPLVTKMAAYRREIAIAHAVDLFLPEVAAFGKRVAPYIAGIIDNEELSNLCYQDALIYSSLLALLSEYTSTLHVEITNGRNRRRLVLSNPDWANGALQMLETILGLEVETDVVEIPKDSAAEQAAEAVA